MFNSASLVDNVYNGLSFTLEHAGQTLKIETGCKPVKMLGKIAKMFGIDKRKGDDEAALLFTSGSSGEPKGVPITHKMILSNTAQLLSKVWIPEGSPILCSLPIFHSFGLTVTMMMPLLTGYSFCAYPNPTDARSLCDLCKRYALTVVCATPTFARAMMRRADKDTFTAVNYFIVGYRKNKVFRKSIHKRKSKISTALLQHKRYCKSIQE